MKNVLTSSNVVEPLLPAHTTRNRQVGLPHATKRESARTHMGILACRGLRQHGIRTRIQKNSTCVATANLHGMLGDHTFGERPTSLHTHTTQQRAAKNFGPPKFDLTKSKFWIYDKGLISHVPWDSANRSWKELKGILPTRFFKYTSK